MSFPRTKEELRQRLIEEANRPPKMITFDEYKRYQELVKFKCPIRKELLNCGGHYCPHKKDDPFHDYYRECVDAHFAYGTIKAVAKGKIVIATPNTGCEIPV